MPDATSTPKTLEEAMTVLKELTEKVNEATRKAEEQTEHARTWEKRAKENKDAAPERDALKKQLADLQSANLSDTDKLQKQIDELTKRLEDSDAARAASDLAAMRARIGAEAGLPAELITRLQGDDEKSILADAQTLAKVATTEGTFRDIGQGNRGTSAAVSSDPLVQTLSRKVGAA